jgi:septation ring formation regulator EzrA
MRTRTLLVLIAALALASALGYWGYSTYQTRLLRGTTSDLVREATQRANAALEERETGAGSLQRLERQFAEASAALQRLASLQGWRDPPLTAAAQRYLDEVEALLRRLIAVDRNQAALQAATQNLTDHVRAARGRSSAWIQDAVNLKREMDRAFFEYRLAAGGLQKSLQTLREARDPLAPLVPDVQLADERRIAEARERLDEAYARLQKETEAAGTLPAPR